MVDQTSVEQVPPLVSLRRRWRLAVARSIAGILVGAIAAVSQGQSYTAEVRLTIGGNTLSANTVPGFALAAQQLASDYARFVSQPGEQQTLHAALGPRAKDVSGISASPAADSSVLLVDTTSSSSALALQSATTVSEALIAAVSRAQASAGPDQILGRYTSVSQQLIAAQNASAPDRAALAAAQASGGAKAVAAAQSALDANTLLVQQLALQQSGLSAAYEQEVASTTQTGELSIVQPAAIVRNDLHARAERYGLGGLVVGVIAALLLAVRADQKRPHGRRTTGRTRSGVSHKARAARGERMEAEERAARADDPPVPAPESPRSPDEALPPAAAVGALESRAEAVWAARTASPPVALSRTALYVPRPGYRSETPEGVLGDGGRSVDSTLFVRSHKVQGDDLQPDVSTPQAGHDADGDDSAWQIESE